MAAWININQELCKKCGICAEFCPKGVFGWDSEEGPMVKEPEKCIRCRQCLFRCPDFAVALEERP